jgi:hypothetical protein
MALDQAFVWRDAGKFPPGFTVTEARREQRVARRPRPGWQRC